MLDALRSSLPLVALETALLTHGLPKPLNLETALEMENEVRVAGAVPCTIGVLDGRVILGLNRDELEELAAAATPLKIGLRELPAAVAGKHSGGTTVSATAHLAYRYGIQVFATGGIGGVHRGANETFDISADLTVLGRTPITVVASGAKAILDLALTLEYLETACVTVAGYKTDFFPAFYSAASPCPLALTMDSSAAAAQAVLSRDELGISAALLLCNPVPAEAGIAWDELMQMISLVESELKTENIVGQDVTPQMLRRLFALSGGRTLQANLALLKENARLGGEVAVSLARERGRSHG